jgi:hypothetical protein
MIFLKKSKVGRCAYKPGQTHYPPKKGQYVGFYLIFFKLTGRMTYSPSHSLTKK